MDELASQVCLVFLSPLATFLPLRFTAYYLFSHLSQTPENKTFTVNTHSPDWKGTPPLESKDRTKQKHSTRKKGTCCTTYTKLITCSLPEFVWSALSTVCFPPPTNMECFSPDMESNGPRGKPLPAHVGNIDLRVRTHRANACCSSENQIRNVLSNSRQYILFIFHLNRLLSQGLTLPKEYVSFMFNFGY